MLKSTQSLPKTASVTKPRRDYGRPVSARVDRDDCTRLAMLARLEATSPADQAREALDQYFKRRLADPALPKEIKRAKRRYADMLAILTPEMPAPSETPKATSVKDASDTEQLTLRIDASAYSRLSAFCLVDDNTLADQLRRAIFEMLEAAWSNSWIQMQIRRMRADLNEVFEDDNAPKEEALERVSEAEIEAGMVLRRNQADEEALSKSYAVAYGS